METRNVGLTILADEKEKIPADRDDVIVPIRTAEGNLMSTRLGALLREYGNRVQVPASLMLEVLQDRHRKACEVRRLQRDLEDYEEFANKAIDVIFELYDAAMGLTAKTVDTRKAKGLVKTSAEINNVFMALETVEAFLYEYVDFEVENNDKEAK